MRWIAHIEGGPKRVNHAAVAVNHKIYSFGGYSTGENCRGYTSMDVHILNTSTNRWTKHPVSDLPYYENDDILPYRRYGHAAVVYKDNIYIWGGRNDRSACSVLFKFDTFWHCWTAPKTTGSIPLARDGHSACVWKKYMFIFGGFEEETDLFAKTVFYLDLETMHWSYVHCCGGFEPTSRDFHTTVCIKDRIFLFGGRGTSIHVDMLGNSTTVETYCNKVWYLDMINFTWHSCQARGDVPVGRRSNSAFVHNDKMYIFGGYNSNRGKHFNDLCMFDPETCVWTRLNLQGKVPCERRRQACAKVGNRVYIFGGTSPHSSSIASVTEEFSLDELLDHSDMYILDLSPSLKTLCMIKVRECGLDESELPQSLRMEVSNMHTPNKITLNRPSNSAG